MKRFKIVIASLIILLVVLATVWMLVSPYLPHALRAGRDVENNFVHPPDTARPWVYWFWNNGNVTKAGITADLEAMKRAGIGGVIIMDVVERFAPPAGTADFMNAEWQELFRFAVSEAHRLGLEINMTNGPGWCGSSGPWITPALSMQRIVSSTALLDGPAHFSGSLQQPNISNNVRHDGFNSTIKYDDYYRDIAVLACPVTTNSFVPVDAVTNLTANLDTNGNLTWDVPPGKWVVQRFGHTTTGSSTRPPVLGGNGLECDKLSREAMDAHFAGMMQKLIDGVGPLAGTTLSATHIDSWEVGSQNWTPKFREEFQKRRGYDPLPYLSDVPPQGRADRSSRDVLRQVPRIGDEETQLRFRWDFQQTISELLADNYPGRLAELAHQHGLRFTMEGYNLPFGDEATYTARSDEPMSEFWATGGAENLTKGRQMASVAHIYGHAVVGAEAFTSGDNEEWKFTPATIKALGDYEFSQGINRFVVHRYAHQPYLDRFPGATMGPWGLHYERTQTWWEMSGAWHEYLSRCQYLLRQGLYVADLCYLRPQLPNQTYFTPVPAVPTGYRFDECSAEALIDRVTVQNGRFVLPDGMKYRLLVLPKNFNLMTPELVNKIKQLVQDGGTVYGPRPVGSPSLSGFPATDDEVVKLAAEVWGDCDGKTVTEHACGKGRVILGEPLTDVLEKLKAPPDFTADAHLNWIHRQMGQIDVYFVANPSPVAVETVCHFRVNGLRPELWNPETGSVSLLAQYDPSTNGTAVPIRLEPSGSTFVVFRQHTGWSDPVTSFTRDGVAVAGSTNRPPLLVVESASYGVSGDAQRTRDVQKKVQTMVDRSGGDIQVEKLAAGDDPARNVVKTLTVQYTVNNRSYSMSGQDQELLNLFAQVVDDGPPAELRCDDTGRVSLEAWQPGHYEWKTKSGRIQRATVTATAAPVEIDGPWDVAFPPKWGAPDRIALDHLASLSESTNSGVKYFSGTATYAKTFDWHPDQRSRHAPPEAWLDLGDVRVMAQVKLNGHDLGTAWKPPFRVNATGALKPGENSLEIRVADLWPNRMIGDAALPENERFTWSSWEPFKKDMPLPKSGLLGPVRVLVGD